MNNKAKGLLASATFLAFGLWVEPGIARSEEPGLVSHDAQQPNACANYSPSSIESVANMSGVCDAPENPFDSDLRPTNEPPASVGDCSGYPYCPETIYCNSHNGCGAPEFPCEDENLGYTKCQEPFTVGGVCGLVCTGGQTVHLRSCPCADCSDMYVVPVCS